MTYKGDIFFIRKVLAGNRQAFSSLVDRHKDNVYSLALKVCCNPEDAEEIAQDAFMKAFRSLSSFRMKSSFSTWLYRITYNTAISSLRSRKRNILSLEEFPADSADFLAVTEDEENAMLEYRRALLNFYLQKLADTDRAIISMFYFQELGINEISGITGMSTSNVKVRLFRARKKIEELVYDKSKIKQKEYEEAGR